MRSSLLGECGTALVFRPISINFLHSYYYILVETLVNSSKSVISISPLI